MKERLISLLRELTALNAPSGFEAPVVVKMRELLSPLADEITVDRMGNLYAVKKGDRPGPTLMITAHSDEIGAIVKSVEPSGFIRFDKIGGTVDALLVGRMVRINGHLGVVGVKAGHLMSDKERSEVKKHTELYIDVGANSADEVAAMGIACGDPISYESELKFFHNSDRFAGKSVDDRIGCVVLVKLFEELQGVSFAGTIVAAVTVQEEVGLRGARVAAHHVNPDFAIALDTMPCGDTPDVNFHRELPVGIGRGPAFQLMSGGGGKPNGLLLNPVVKRLLVETAQKAGLPYQVTTFTGGNTDASAMHLVGDGIPSGVVAIPRRYSHSPVEMADINDAVAATKLLKALTLRLGEGIDWSFA